MWMEYTLVTAKAEPFLLRTIIRDYTEGAPKKAPSFLWEELVDNVASTLIAPIYACLIMRVII